MRVKFLECATQEEASEAAAEILADALASDGEDRMTFFASGGSTPVKTLQKLSEAGIIWSLVTVGLVDERWVPPEHEASNEAMIRRALLRHDAGAAGLIPLKTAHASPREAAAERSIAYEYHCNPIDAILLGMGNDGHTASWFPGAAGLTGALSIEAEAGVVYIDAKGCPGAGGYTDRLTLNARAVCGAETAVLLIFGAEKRRIFEASLSKDPMEAPIRFAVDGLRERLQVIWAP